MFAVPDWGEGRDRKAAPMGPRAGQLRERTLETGSVGRAKRGVSSTLGWPCSLVSSAECGWMRRVGSTGGSGSGSGSGSDSGSGRGGVGGAQLVMSSWKGTKDEGEWHG